MAPLALLVIAFLAAACSGTDVAVGSPGPSPVSTKSSVSFATTSPTAFSQIVSTPSCSTGVPFSVPVNLVVTVNGDVAVFITAISFAFTDMSGITTPQVTLPAPIPTAQFGTALVQARSSRTFPLTLPVGCWTDHKGTMVMQVSTRDELGSVSSGQVSVVVH
jgi:hypothetical protein